MKKTTTTSTSTSKAASTNTNPLAKFGKQSPAQSQAKAAPAPLYVSNKIAMRMKDGDVSVAAIINGEFTSYMAEKYFVKASKANSVPNVLAAVCDVVEALKGDDSIKEGKTVIAIPNRAAYISNNLGLLTRMAWSGKNLLDKDSTGNFRTMSDKEMALYTRLSSLLCECASFICIMDSEYTHRNKSTAVTDEQKEWSEVNNASYYMLHQSEPGDDKQQIDEDEELA